jgi:hypothetical protein
MLAKAAALSLTLCAALADSGGSHQAAYYLLLGAVPAASVAALASLGDLVEAGRPVAAIAVVQTLLSVLVTALVVVSTAARSTALLSGQVPRVAVSALVGCLVLYGLQGALVCLVDVRHRLAHEEERDRPRADRPLSRAA